jgi:hypothetical protein
MGSLRLEKWLHLPAVQDYALQFRFRLGRLPKGPAPLLRVCVRAEQPALNRRGLDRTSLQAGEWVGIRLGEDGTLHCQARCTRQEGPQSAISRPSGANRPAAAADTWYTFAAEVRGRTLSVSLNGEPQVKITGASHPLQAFGIYAPGRKTQPSGHVDIDDVVVRRLPEKAQ